MTNSSRHLWQSTLALLMSVLMVVTLLPLNVFAKEEPVVDPIAAKLPKNRESKTNWS